MAKKKRIWRITIAWADPETSGALRTTIHYAHHAESPGVEVFDRLRGRGVEISVDDLGPLSWWDDLRAAWPVLFPVIEKKAFAFNAGGFDYTLDLAGRPPAGPRDVFTRLEVARLAPENGGRDRRSTHTQCGLALEEAAFRARHAQTWSQVLEAWLSAWDYARLEVEREYPTSRPSWYDVDDFRLVASRIADHHADWLMAEGQDGASWRTQAGDRVAAIAAQLSERAVSREEKAARNAEFVQSIRELQERRSVATE